MNGTGVSAILLAAGESRRMGAVNKLTLDIGGIPLLRRAAETLLAARLSEVVVVVGHDADTARSLLSGLGMNIVENPHYGEGQMTSVYRGMGALTAPCEGVMVCLSDLPLIEAGDLDALVGAFLDECPRSILVPTYEGRRGNPVILAQRHRESILAGDRTLGGKRPIDRHPELVWTHPVENDHCVFDLDTPEDYDRLCARLAAAAE
jgi:molybdenum cofactor cytidylyltransferase